MDLDVARIIEHVKDGAPDPLQQAAPVTAGLAAQDQEGTGATDPMAGP